MTLAEGIETEEELAFLAREGLPAGPGLLLLQARSRAEEIIAYAFGGIPSAAALRAA